MDVIEYLTSKGLHGRQTSGNEVAYPCFFCGEPADSRKLKLYVNAETGMYECKVCMERGGTTLLQRHFGDDPRADQTPVPTVGRRGAVLEAATALGVEMLQSNDDRMLYLLNERGLTPETILERRLGYAAPGWSLTGNLPPGFSAEDLKSSGLVYRDGPRAGQDFLYHHLLIPYLVGDRVVQVRGRAEGNSGGKYMTGPGDPVRLFNEEDASCDDVIITEGEFDAMLLKQVLSLSPEERVRRIGVVGLAGANALPDAFATYFEKAKRVFVGFDSDDTGKRGAVKVQEVLGAKARILEFPIELVERALADGKKKVDWTDWFVTYGGRWSDVTTLMGAASGKRVFTMAEAGVSFRTSRTNATGLKLGFAELDATLEPGLLPGQLMIPLAKTGTGKTVWLCNVAYNLRNRPVLFVTLEMTREEIYGLLSKIYRFHKPHASDEMIEFAFSQLAICDENRLRNGDLSSLVDEYEVEFGCRPELVVVDYLGYYARGFKGGSPYEKTSDAVMELKAQAKVGRFAVIAPHQVNRMGKEGKPLSADDARDSGVVEETADFMLGLFRPEESRDENGQASGGLPNGKVKMQLLKSRHGGKDRCFTLQMSMLTLAMVDDMSREAKMAAHETYLYGRNMTYKEYRAEQTAPVQMEMRGRDRAAKE